MAWALLSAFNRLVERTRSKNQHTNFKNINLTKKKLYINWNKGDVPIRGNHAIEKESSSFYMDKKKDRLRESQESTRTYAVQTQREKSLNFSFKLTALGTSTKISRLENCFHRIHFTMLSHPSTHWLLLPLSEQVR